MGGFTFFWEGSVIRSLLNGEDHSGNGGSLWLFAIFGSFFVVAGLYIVFGRFFYKRMRAMRTYYAVTNRRVLVLVIMFGRHLVAGYIRDVQSIETSFNCDGSGTIRFGNSPWWSGSLDNSEMDPFEMSRSSAVPVFLDISNAREAYRIVNEAKDAPS